MRYEVMVPMKVYQTRECYLPRGDRPGYNQLVFMLTKDQKDTIETLSSGYIKYKESLYKKYYIDGRYNTKIGRKKIVKNLKAELTKQYAESEKVSKQLVPIPYASKNQQFKKNKSTIVDLGQWMGYFFKNLIAMPQTQDSICNKFIDYLANLLTEAEYEGYDKYLYIDMDYWFDNKTPLGMQKSVLVNPVNIFLCCAYKFPDLIKRLGRTELILADANAGQMMRIPASSMTKDNLSTIKSRLKMFKAVRVVEEDESTGDPVIDKMNSDIAKTNAERLERVEKAKKNIINSLKKHFMGNPDDITSDYLSDDYEDNDIISSDNAELDGDIEDIAIQYFEDNPDIIETTEERDIVDTLVDIAKQKVYITKFIPEKSKKELENISRLTKTQEEALAKVSVDKLKAKLIDTTDISDMVQTGNPDLLNIKMANFDTSYATKLLESDLVDMVTSLSNTDSKIFVTDIEKRDSSSQLDIKDTYTFTLENELGKTNSISVDVPRVIDGKYLFLNGSKKTFGHQLILKPVVKNGKDTVVVTTFYNKVTLTRKGDVDVLPSSIKKYLLNDVNGFKVRYGNSVVKNKQYQTDIGFDIVAKNLYSFTIGDNVFNTNINELLDIMKSKEIDTSGLDIKAGDIPIGYNKKTRKALVVKKGENYADIMYNLLPEEGKSTINSMKVSKRLSYTTVKMYGKEFPVVLFMLFCEGLASVMKKANIEYKIIDPREIKEYNQLEWGYTPLSDSMIVWKRYPLQNSLLMNGLQNVQTELYSKEEMESKETFATMLTEYFPMNKIPVLDQFKDFMIDPVTKDILTDFGMPTNLTELFCYTVELLCNNNFAPENNMNNMRVRSTELIPFYLYNAVANAYLPYRKTQHKKSPTKISVKKDCILKMLGGNPLVNEASDLNPILELEKGREITYKGDRGINKDRVMTLSKRGYDKTMLGVLGISTPNDGNVGVMRQLTLEPSITSTRGYIEINNDPDKLTSRNILTPAELLTPFAAVNDDPTRTSMTYKQSKYMTLTENSDPVMIGNKVESIIPYYMSDVFTIIAADDGEIVSIENDIVTIKYVNGTYKSFDVSPQTKKNASAGFYVEYQLVCEKKVGDKVKKNEVVAYNNSAFKRNKHDGSVSMRLGKLVKVAIFSGWDIYEDSGPVNMKTSNNMATTMVDAIAVTLNKNSYIDYMAKIGDKVNTADPLIKFDEAGDPEQNSLINSIREDLRESVIADSITTKKSKHTGVISDIKIYVTVDEDELSPSLKKIVSDYNKKINAKIKTLSKFTNIDDTDYYKSGFMITESPNKVIPDANGKVKGEKVDEGVLIIFYVKYTDVLKKGDKLCGETALKYTISHVIDPGYEAYSEYRPEEEIDTVIAPLAISARKTPSLYKSMFGNKLMIELKRQCKEIYYEEDKNKK